MNDNECLLLAFIVFVYSVFTYSIFGSAPIDVSAKEMTALLVACVACGRITSWEG